MKRTLPFSGLVERKMFLLTGMLYLFAFLMTSYSSRSFNQTIGPAFDSLFYLKTILMYDWVIFLITYALINLLRIKTNATLSTIHLFTILASIANFEFQSYFRWIYVPILIISYVSFILNIIKAFYTRNNT